jgi:hypothetical protein
MTEAGKREEYQEGYSSGVWDTVALINENEDMTLNWRDIINALAIKKISEEL